MSMASVLTSNTPADGVTTETTAAVISNNNEAQPETVNDDTASVDGEEAEDSLSRAQYDFPLPPSSPPASSIGHGHPPLPPMPSAGTTLVSVYHAASYDRPYDPPSPTSPAPFSDIIVPPPRTSASLGNNANISRTSITTDGTAPPKNSFEFHTRQRRAAKLSKFFGVEMNSLVDVLPANRLSSATADMNVRRDGPGRNSVQRKISDESDAMTLVSGEAVKAESRVEVSAELAKGPLRFLHGQAGAKDLDMADAIDKLRRMKSV